MISNRKHNMIKPPDIDFTLFVNKTNEFLICNISDSKNSTVNSQVSSRECRNAFRITSWKSYKH